MTIKELKQAIAELPDDMDVFIGERFTEEKYGLVNSVRTETIAMSDEGKHWYTKALILTED